MRRLIGELRIAHGDGSYIPLKSLSKAALTVLDDWGLTALKLPGESMRKGGRRRMPELLPGRTPVRPRYGLRP